MSDDSPKPKSRLRRLTELYRVSRAIHSTLEPAAALQIVVAEAARLVGASSSSLVLFNPTSGRLEIEAHHGLPPEAAAIRFLPGQGLTGWVARTGKPARIADVTRDARCLALRPGVRSELAVPLPETGDVRGVLHADSTDPDAFTAADQALLEELADQAASVIRNTWRFEQLRLKAQLFESLAGVSQTISSTLNLDDALHAITADACRLMKAKVCSLLLLDERAEWLELRASHGASAAYRNKPKLSVAESLLGTVVRRRKPIQLADVASSARYQQGPLARREGLVSLLSTPLVFNGEAIGVLSVYTGEPHVFSDEEVRILTALAGLSAIAIEKARLHERIVDVEEQLRQTEKLSAIGLLAAEVAHEIRNPLTVLKMLFHSLDLKFPPADPRGEDVRVMGEKMEHLNRIVEQILDFARNSEPRLAPLNLNQLLDGLGLLTRHKLRQQGIELVRQFETGLPEVRADAGQLEQVFLNLTLNAVEAMPEGGRLTLVTRTVRPARRSTRPTQVSVEFRDNGVGLTASQRRRLFSSILNTTKARGTGLGLAIVARIVEGHRGTVKVSSRPGKGTTFAVILPVG